MVHAVAGKSKKSSQTVEGLLGAMNSFSPGRNWKSNSREIVPEAGLPKMNVGTADSPAGKPPEPSPE
jgi:hypothetical protein